MTNENQLVELINNQISTTSIKIAEVFSKKHKHILRAIENILLELPKDFTGLNFGLSDYIDPTGRKLPMYNITKDGFTFLVMGFTGEKAAKFKIAYIQAFNKMESYIKSKESKEAKLWAKNRGELKLTRERWGDALELFVEYAKNQGSENAYRYYEIVTMMEYKTLNFIAGNPKCTGLRDLLDHRNLAQLRMLEQECSDAILEAMEQKKDYKEVYQHAKRCCVNLALNFRRIDKPILDKIGCKKSTKESLIS